MTYSAAEREAIGLCICLEAIDDIANHALLEIRDVSAFPGESEIWFKTHIHQQLFLIRVLDFVKESGNKQLTGVAGSCLQVLKEAAATKSFDVNDSVRDLKDSVEALENWLIYRKKITLWLPTLDINATIEVSRLDFLKITGNHFKHNLSRLTEVSKDVVTILKKHGYDVPVECVPLALDDFREHLAENYFAYYGTWLAELLNNVRWGIQLYLAPTFANSYKVIAEEEFRYGYEYPSGIQESVPREWFWRLMNNIRTGPYLKKFSGAHYLKKESSLEWQK
jgi:hypothetical protein